MLTLPFRSAALAILILTFMSGCGYSNPEYYKALTEVTQFLDSMKLPTAEQLDQPTTAHNANVAELVRLNKAVEGAIDPRVSQRPSYIAYEKALKDMVVFTQQYNINWMHHAQGGEVDSVIIGDIVAKGEKDRVDNVAALKKAIARENPSKG